MASPVQQFTIGSREEIETQLNNNQARRIMNEYFSANPKMMDGKTLEERGYRSDSKSLLVIFTGAAIVFTITVLTFFICWVSVHIFEADWPEDSGLRPSYASIVVMLSFLWPLAVFIGAYGLITRRQHAFPTFMLVSCLATIGTQSMYALSLLRVHRGTVKAYSLDFILQTVISIASLSLLLAVAVAAVIHQASRKNQNEEKREEEVTRSNVTTLRMPNYQTMRTFTGDFVHYPSPGGTYRPVLSSLC